MKNRVMSLLSQVYFSVLNRMGKICSLKPVPYPVALAANDWPHPGGKVRQPKLLRMIK